MTRGGPTDAPDGFVKLMHQRGRPSRRRRRRRRGIVLGLRPNQHLTVFRTTGNAIVIGNQGGCPSDIAHPILVMMMLNRRSRCGIALWDILLRPFSRAGVALPKAQTIVATGRDETRRFLVGRRRSIVIRPRRSPTNGIDSHGTIFEILDGPHLGFRFMTQDGHASIRRRGGALQSKFRRRKTNAIDRTGMQLMSGM